MPTQTPLEKLGLRLHRQLQNMKYHFHLVSSDMENLGTNLDLLHQTLVIQEIEIKKLNERLLNVEETLTRNGF